MFRIIGQKWSIEEIDFDPDMVEYQFKRNFPLNLLDDAQTQAAYKGLVSEKTRLANCAIVKDVEAEIEAMSADTDIDLERAMEFRESNPEPAPPEEEQQEEVPPNA
jgi:hypothetical protein